MTTPLRSRLGVRRCRCNVDSEPRPQGSGTITDGLRAQDCAHLPVLSGCILNRARRITMTTKPTDRTKRELKNLEAVAGNGLLHRRLFLRGGAALAGAMTGYTLVPSASGQQLAEDTWSLAPGVTVPEYGVRSKFEKTVRTLSNPK